LTVKKLGNKEKRLQHCFKQGSDHTHCILSAAAPTSTADIAVRPRDISLEALPLYAIYD
jgi:hypothetical protein